MRFVAVFVISSFYVSTVCAQTLHVSGVAGNDVLKMRVYPNVQSGVVGVIPPYARGITDLNQSANGWRFVRWQNAEGWVAARFLAPDLPRGRALSPDD